MHRSKKQVTSFSYGQDDGVMNDSLMILMFSGLGVAILVCSLFLLFNVFVKESLIRSNDKISMLEGIKQNQENTINSNISNINSLSDKLELTDKDLKDRIKTNRYLNSTLVKEKEQKAAVKSSLTKLENKHNGAVKSFESSENTTKDLFLALEMEKEQHDSLQSKYKVLNSEYDLKILQLKELEILKSNEKDKYNALQEKYLDNIDYIEELEKGIQHAGSILEQQTIINNNLQKKVDALSIPVVPMIGTIE